MRLVAQKEGDLSSYSDIYDESEVGTNISSLKQILIDDHVEANSGVVGCHLPLKSIFRFARSFKKITKSIGFDTILGKIDVIVTINSNSLYITTLIPQTKTLVLFNETITKPYTLSNEPWTTN